MPFLVLSILATVIASQAMISGMFSIVYQSMTTHVMPLFKVAYTSKEIRSQIYLPAVNWFLLVAVIFIMIEFRESSKLAAAYGLAVTGTMTITGIFMTWIFWLRNKRTLAGIAACVMLADILYLIANIYKDTAWRLLVHHHRRHSAGNHSCLHQRAEAVVPEPEADGTRRVPS